jgi:hypothetical protein
MAVQQISAGTVVHHIDAEPALQSELAEDESSLDTTEEKRLKRMRRNRESAAQSRNRKKQYVDSLESEIRALKSTINNLTSENYELRREHARLTGAPPPVAPEAIAVLAPVDPDADGDGAEASASGAPPSVVTHVISADARLVAAPHASLAAPSPRASDALLGLELLSRSASINGGEKEGEGEGEGAAEVMSAEPTKEEDVVGEAGNVGNTGAQSQSGSSASSMVMGALGCARRTAAAMRARARAPCGTRSLVASSTRRTSRCVWQTPSAGSPVFACHGHAARATRLGEIDAATHVAKRGACSVAWRCVGERGDAHLVPPQHSRPVHTAHILF